MARSLLNQVTDTVARRCWVPRDLEAITVRGAESGDADSAEQIWGRVEDLYRTGVHPGIQVCIRHQGDVVVDRAIGHARGNRPGHRLDPDHAVPMELDTPVNLFSAAKAITAMLMHKLEEEGVLGLDDRVSDYVPGFGRHGKGDITIRQVLSHRSGTPSLPSEAFDLELLADPERIEAMLCDLEPSAMAGGPPAYHAVVGGFVMEAVAQRAAGRSLRDVLAVDIRDPLALTWFDLGVDEADAHKVAHNVETGFPLLKPLEMMMSRVLGTRWDHVLHLSNDPRFLTGIIPSGNVIVTANDAATFYQCLLNGGSINGVRVFKEDTIAGAIAHEGEGLPLDRQLFMPMRYSAGFMLGAEQASLYGWNHPRAFGHVGMSNLFTWADPDRDLVVALLTTGKPVLGPHIVALPRLISTIHEVFPDQTL
ncbi:MAG: serine hydrolase domain-containing protein [Acidimicrobiales bacterium]